MLHSNTNNIRVDGKARLKPWGTYITETQLVK